MATAVEISRAVKATRTGIEVTRVIDVEPYSAWFSVCSTILGGVRLVGGVLYRTPPWSDPTVPWAFADSVDVEGLGAFTGLPPSDLASTLAASNYYRRARLTIVYKSLEVPDQDNPDQSEQKEMDLSSETMDFGVQNVTIPGSTFYWRYAPSAPMPTIIPYVKRIPNLKLTYARHFVLKKPVNAITQLVGRINYYSFRIGGSTWPAETVRFEGANVTQKVTNLGVQYHDITYTFAVMPVFDWIALSEEKYNLGPDPAGGSTERITAGVKTPSKVKRAYVGWNRTPRLDRTFWDRPVSFSEDPAYNYRGIHEYDKDVKQTLRGGEVAGFRLLFHPAAL